MNGSFLHYLSCKAWQAGRDLSAMSIKILGGLVPPLQIGLIFGNGKLHRLD